MARLVCSTCHQAFSINDPIWRCPCGGLLDIVETPTFRPQKIDGHAAGQWRYRALLPIERDENIITFGEGWTPLIRVDIFGSAIFFKMDHLMPSGSFKDRGASLLTSRIKELGIDKIVEDSSGNAGAAIAMYGAAANILCDILVPEDISRSKLRQIQAMGATIAKISGGRDATTTAALKAAETVYYASHSWNPFFFQGTKTIAYEICEQLGWNAPDYFISPVGNGTLLLGVYIGFSELVNSGIIKQMPAILAVQTESCPPLATAFAHASESPARIEKNETIAEGIAVGKPVRGAQILNAVRQSGGAFLTVTEDEIKSMLRYLHKKGIYVEPTAAVAPAGAAKAKPILAKGRSVVSVFTGHGLKSKG